MLFPSLYDNRRTFPAIILTCLLATLHYPASAAQVTLNESGLDAIFSQVTFGANDVDVRFATIVRVVAADLVGVDSPLEFLDVRNLVPSPDASAETAQMFFTDAVDSCGGVNSTGIVGCSVISSAINNSGDNVFYSIVESSVAAGPSGAELLAHELTHQLGLGHQLSGLMGETLDGDTTLTASEVNSILNSPLIQLDGTQRFIEIVPILVQASPVPEPSSLTLCGLLGLSLVPFARHRRRASSQLDR